MPQQTIISISRRGRSGVGLALLLLASLVSGRVDATETRFAVGDICPPLARASERAEGIPPGLVHAVALAESGRWFEQERRTHPWPWTITAFRDSFFLPSKEAALAKVRELQSSGRTNIDVGCMQVNLGYHGHAFDSLEAALDPETNISYGARYLKRLRQETRSWARATARYHSKQPERGQAYRERVFRLWEQVRRQARQTRPPTRLAGSLLGSRASAGIAMPAGRRLIVPGLAPDLAPALDRPAAPGAIPILRGQ